MIKPKPQIKLRHSDTGEIISVSVFVGGKELDKSDPEYVAAVEKLRHYKAKLNDGF